MADRSHGASRHARCATILALLLCACDAAEHGRSAGQAPGSRDATTPVVPERLRTLGEAEGVELFDVRDAAVRNSGLVVLTSPEPAIHRFSGGQLRNQWGNEGEGPAELSSPRDAAWMNGHLLVLDFQLGGSKIVSHDTAGTFVASRSTVPHTATSLALSGSDTLIGTWQFGSDARAVLRLRGEAFDTLLSYRLGEQVRLTAEGAPSLTLSAPFSPQPVWAALPDGGIAFWAGEADSILVIGAGGDTVGGLPLPRGRYPLADEDREAWFEAEMPVEDFMGRGDIFAPLREKAREDLEFPPEFPAALALLADPGGGVWIQRIPMNRGEVWTRVDADGIRASVRFPPGRELLEVGTSELIVLTRDELDVEAIEVYGKPDGS